MRLWVFASLFLLQSTSYLLILDISLNHFRINNLKSSEEKALEYVLWTRKPGSTRTLIPEIPKIHFPALTTPQYVMCHSHFLLPRVHIIVASEMMLQARRNANFWNGKMIACTVIAGYHKCQSYLTARQNKGWPQFEAVKLHSNQNKNKKSSTQMYFFVYYWKL